MSKLFEAPVKTLEGRNSSLRRLKGTALLIVNVASECGLTPQYRALEKLHEKYADRGFSVVGFPCNQFAGQEPGSADEIRTFCSTKYGVTFPLFEKINVNGSRRHPIYRVLTKVPDAEGKAGDVQWNFEKFVVSADGKTITRFRPTTKPNDRAVVKAIEAGLPKRKLLVHSRRRPAAP
jgi:glutathione peroxidase